MAQAPLQMFDYAYLQRYQDMQQYSNMHIMTACGPFTHRTNLLYEPLKDLFRKIENEQPNVLILMGPFLDWNHEQISEGNLSFKNPNNEGKLEFLDYSELFDKLFEFISGELNKSPHTKVVLIPSAREVEMI